MKICIRCGEEKPLTDYYRDGRFLDKPYLAACKTCISVARRVPKKSKPTLPKACSQCGIVKPPHEFVLDKKHADGLRAQCKACFYTPERYERDQAWRKQHPEKVREYNLQSRPKRDPYTVQWKKEHPDHVRMQDARKRAKRRSNSGIRDLTRAQWEAIKATYKFCCVYCGEKRKRLTMDHVIPLIRGGAHTAANVVPACRNCNASKKDRQPPTFQPMLVH